MANPGKNMEYWTTYYCRDSFLKITKNTIEMKYASQRFQFWALIPEK
jgi:hypothetical protein